MSELTFHGAEENFIKEWNGDVSILRKVLRNDDIDMKRLYNEPIGAWLLRHSSYNKTLDENNIYKISCIKTNAICLEGDHCEIESIVPENIERFFAVSCRNKNKITHELILKTKNGSYATANSKWYENHLVLWIMCISSDLVSLLTKKGYSAELQLNTSNQGRADDYLG